MHQETGSHYNELGNEACAVKSYDEAYRYYIQAISHDPKNAAYYCNRSACLLKLKCYNDALEDAVTASTINPKYPKAQYQLAECYLMSGNYILARRAYKNLEELGYSQANVAEFLTRNDQLEQDEQQTIHLFAEQKYEQALQLARSIAERSPVNNRVLSTQIECLLKLKSIKEAEEIYYDYLCSDEHLIEIKYLRALFKYYRNELDMALDLCKEITDDDPDFTKAVKLFKIIKRYKDRLDAGNRAFANGDYSGADKLYSDGLVIDPTNELSLVKLYVNKAIANNKMNLYKEAIASCTKALNIDKNNLKAIVNRAEAAIKTGELEAAIKDYMKAYEICKDKEIFNKLEKLKADEEVKKQNSQYDIDKFINKYKNSESKHSQQNQQSEEKKEKSQDQTQARLMKLQETLTKMKTMKPHEILEVPENPNETDIRKGYSKCVKRYHPDYVANFPALKKVCEEIFKIVQNAKSKIENRRRGK